MCNIPPCGTKATADLGDSAPLAIGPEPRKMEHHSLDRRNALERRRPGVVALTSCQSESCRASSGPCADRAYYLTVWNKSHLPCGVTELTVLIWALATRT